MDATVLAVGPHQLQKLDATHVTVRWPVGETTVLSIQPDGQIDTRPEGTCGPYEVALLAGDRLVYAPQGAEGPVYIVPYTSALP
jgi:hypothetical protein